MDTLHLDRRAARRPAGGDLAARVLELGRRFGAVHHRLVGAVAALDDSGLWALDGHSTCAAWVAEHLAVAYGTAREWLRVGHALTRLTAIDAAFGCGDLTYAQVRTLTRIAVDHPSREHDLLDLAVRTPARHLAVALAEWCTRHEAPDDLDRRHRRDTGLTARIEPDGMGVITLRLPPLEHGQLMAVIDTNVMTSRRTAPGQPTERGGNASTDERSTPSVNDNGRAPERPSLAQQRTHALVALLTDGGANLVTEVILHVRADGTTLHDGTPINPGTVAALLPTAFIRAMVHDAQGHPIDVSQRHRYPTDRQKLVVDEREPTCPCDATAFLEYHHEPPYEATHHTMVDELQHRCSRCHRRRHASGR